MVQQRLEYIDIAKGIGILLVVMGHCISGQSVPGMYISAFHMPLFFIISGMCFNDVRYPQFILFLRKRVQTLFMPLLYFTMIILALCTWLIPDYYTLSQLPYRFPNAYWFVFVLFLSELLFYVVNRCLKSTMAKWIFIGFCLAGSTLLMAADIHLPHKISSVCIATFFYGLGFLAKSRIKQIVNNLNVFFGGDYFYCQPSLCSSPIRL